MNANLINRITNNYEVILDMEKNTEVSNQPPVTTLAISGELPRINFANSKLPASIPNFDPTGIRFDFLVSVERIMFVLKCVVWFLRKIIGECPPIPKSLDEAESTYEKLAYCNKHKVPPPSAELAKGLAEILYMYRDSLIPIASPFDDYKTRLSKKEDYHFNMCVGKTDRSFDVDDYNTIADVFEGAKDEAALMRLAMTEVEMLYYRECKGITELDSCIPSRGSKKYISKYIDLRRKPHLFKDLIEWRIPYNNIQLSDFFDNEFCLVKSCLYSTKIEEEVVVLESSWIPVFIGGFRRLVEVFCRSCIISLRNLDNFDEIICNDADYKIISYFEMAQYHIKKLTKQIRLMIEKCIELMKNSPNGSSSKEATEYIKERIKVKKKSKTEQKIIAAAAFFILVNFSYHCNEKNLFNLETFTEKVNNELDTIIDKLTYTSRFLHRIKFTNYDFRKVIQKYDLEDTILADDSPYIRGGGTGCEDYSDRKNKSDNKKKKLSFSEKDMEDVFSLPQKAACLLFHYDKYKVSKLANKYKLHLIGVYRTPGDTRDTNVYAKNVPDEYKILKLPPKMDRSKSSKRELSYKVTPNITIPAITYNLEGNGKQSFITGAAKDSDQTVVTNKTLTPAISSDEEV